MNVNINEKVKEKLKEFKKEKGCTSFSDAINHLLLMNWVYDQMTKEFEEQYQYRLYNNLDNWMEAIISVLAPNSEMHKKIVESYKKLEKKYAIKNDNIK